MQLFNSFSENLIKLLIFVFVIGAPEISKAAPGTGVGNEYVRNHPFIVGATNLHSAVLDPTEMLTASFNYLFAFAETTANVSIASGAGIPWFAHIEPPGTGMDSWFQTLVNQAAAYSGCQGWNIFDEPNRLEMSVAKDAADWVRIVSPNTLVYPVAFPSYAPADMLYGNSSNPAYTWSQYLDDFLSITQPDIFAFDHYPFIDDGSTLPTFFSDLMLFRQKAIAADLPYFAFLQTWPFWNRRIPSESDLRMQAYSYLAAGYSGLFNFIYDYSNGNGLLDSNGDPTPIYYYSATMNEEILNLGKCLKYLISEDVRYLPGKHSSSQFNSVPSGLTQWSSSAGNDPHIIGAGVSISGSADYGYENNGLLGFFTDDNSQHYFMLVNLNHAASLTAYDARDDFYIQFDNTVNSILELDTVTGNTNTINLVNHTLYTTMLGGSGRLFKYNNGGFYVGVPLQFVSVASSNIAQTSVQIDIVFNQNAQAQIEYGTDTGYGQLSTKEMSFNFSSHSQTLLNLTPGTTYHYRAHGWDQNGTEIVSGDYQFTTSSGTTPDPLQIISVASSNIAQTSAQIDIVFNQNAQAQVEYGTDTGYGQLSTKETSFNFSSHSQTLLNLTPGTTYHYRVHGWDQNGVEVISNDYQFTTLSLPLQILTVGTSDILETSAKINFVFNQNAQAQVEYGIDTGYGQLTTKETSFNFSSFSELIQSLTPDTTYHYRIHGWDQNGFEVVSNDYQFTTSVGNTPDPLEILSVGASEITGTSAKISVLFNQNAQAQVEYGIDTNYGELTVKETSFNFSSHSQVIDNLEPDTIYHYRVHGWDQNGVEVISDDYQFTTSVGVTPEDLEILSVDATLIDEDSVQIKVIFNQNAQAQIEYGADTSYGFFDRKEESFNYSFHTMILNDLTPNAIYHYRVHGWDHNGTEVVSDDYQFKVSKDATNNPTNNEPKSSGGCGCNQAGENSNFPGTILLILIALLIINQSRYYLNIKR